jgi:hypothetical protein
VVELSGFSQLLRKKSKSTEQNTINLKHDVVARHTENEPPQHALVRAKRVVMPCESCHKRGLDCLVEPLKAECISCIDKQRSCSFGILSTIFMIVSS